MRKLPLRETELQPRKDTGAEVSKVKELSRAGDGCGPLGCYLPRTTDEAAHPYRKAARSSRSDTSAFRPSAFMAWFDGIHRPLSGSASLPPQESPPYAQLELACSSPFPAMWAHFRLSHFWGSLHKYSGPKRFKKSARIDGNRPRAAPGTGPDKAFSLGFVICEAPGSRQPHPRNRAATSVYWSHGGLPRARPLSLWKP